MFMFFKKLQSENVLSRLIFSNENHFQKCSDEWKFDFDNQILALLKISLLCLFSQGTTIFFKYRTRAIITHSRLETTLEY